MAKLWLHQSDSYEITTEVYSGPLDLLLDLIQKAELDISKLALAQVTDQLLEFIENNKDAEPDFLSEFVIIAAKLDQIKSDALLPRPPLRSD
jgi:segregation and condensation protein A